MSLILLAPLFSAPFMTSQRVQYFYQVSDSTILSEVLAPPSEITFIQTWRSNSASVFWQETATGQF